MQNQLTRKALLTSAGLFIGLIPGIHLMEAKANPPTNQQASVTDLGQKQGDNTHSKNKTTLLLQGLQPTSIQDQATNASILLSTPQEVIKITVETQQSHNQDRSPGQKWHQQPAENNMLVPPH